MFKHLKTLYNYAFNNNVVNYIKKNQACELTSLVIKDAGKGPICFFKGVKQAKKAPEVYKRLYPNKTLTSKQIRCLRWGIFNKNMKNVYTDPAQIGAVIGMFIPFPLANPAGYLIGSGLKFGYRGAKAACDFIKRA